MNNNIIIIIIALLILYFIIYKPTFEKFNIFNENKLGDFGDKCDPNNNSMKCKPFSNIGASNQLPLICAGDPDAYTCRVKPDFTNISGPCKTWSSKSFDQLTYNTIPYCTPKNTSSVKLLDSSITDIYSSIPTNDNTNVPYTSIPTNDSTNVSTGISTYDSTNVSTGVLTNDDTSIKTNDSTSISTNDSTNVSTGISTNDSTNKKLEYTKLI